MCFLQAGLDFDTPRLPNHQHLKTRFCNVFHTFHDFEAFGQQIRSKCFSGGATCLRYVVVQELGLLLGRARAVGKLFARFPATLDNVLVHMSELAFAILSLKSLIHHSPFPDVGMPASFSLDFPAS
jgi:hypothetical protein